LSYLPYLNIEGGVNC